MTEEDLDYWVYEAHGEYVMENGGGWTYTQTRRRLLDHLEAGRERYIEPENWPVAIQYLKRLLQEERR